LITMTCKIGHVTLLVKDYDEAIDFYVNKAQFSLVEDAVMSPTMRWVVIEPKGCKGQNTTQILLAKAMTEQELQAVGNQCGGRVLMFLNTDNFYRDYESMKAKGIEFLETPREEVYATVVVFQDLYGNKWDLLQRKP
jgi:catechol 2,3-dioxygenase-like lactoylglutathione lyase family enzyme